MPSLSLSEQFARGLIARAKERRLGPFKPPEAAAIVSPASRGNQIEVELADLLANHKVKERRRAPLTPEDRAAEERETDAYIRQIREDAERDRRTVLKARRDGDDTIHKLSRDELTTKGFAPLFALRRGTEDVYFAADDVAWYRIEAYPEYVRSGTPPPAYFLAPPWESELSPYQEALDRYRAIIQERKHHRNTLEAT